MAQSMRDEPGTQREFETIFILRPDTNQDGIQPVNTRVTRRDRAAWAASSSSSTTGASASSPTKSRSSSRASTSTGSTSAPPGVVEEIERNLRMLDTVIRYYTVKVDEDVDPDGAPAGVDDETFNKAATTVPDEEELVTGAARCRASRTTTMPDLDDEFLAGRSTTASAPIKDEGVSHGMDTETTSARSRRRRSGDGGKDRTKATARASVASRAARCAASAPTRTSPSTTRIRRP